MREVYDECGCKCGSRGGRCGRHGAGDQGVRRHRASGAIVRVEPEDFLRILQRQPEPLVVHATGGFFSTSYRYLSSYKGLAFFTQSPAPLSLPNACELVRAQKLWMPG